MTTPAISIIMPIYNAEKYLRESINSLQKQTFSNFELVAIDDESTDTSCQIIEEYMKNDTRIRLLKQKNQGPGKAREYGIREANGQYIMFCDSDDLFDPMMCEKMYNAIDSNNVDWAVCDVNLFPQSTPKSLFTKTEVVHYDHTNCPVPTICLWCYIFRKSIIEKYNILFPESYYGEDNAYVHKYLWASTSGYMLAEKLYNYRQNPSSLMNTVKTKIDSPRVKSSLSIVFDLYNFLTQHHLYEKYKVEYFSIALRVLVFQSQGLSQTAEAEIYDKLHDFFKNKNIIPHYSLFKMIKSGNFPTFYSALKSTNLSGCRRKKIGGFNLLKIKETPVAKTIYFSGLPIYHKKW